MKTLFLTILIFLGPQIAGIAAEPQFFEAPGKYALSSDLFLEIAPGDSPGKMDFMIKYSRGGGNGGVIELLTTHDSFFFFWDPETQILWWGTTQNFGYLDIHKPTSAKSSSHSRHKPILPSDQFPPAPPMFKDKLNHLITR